MRELGESELLGGETGLDPLDWGVAGLDMMDFRGVLRLPESGVKQPEELIPSSKSIVRW